jgi:NADH-quinone oxidoreductase subunit N
MNFSADLGLTYPELILAIGAMALLLFGAFAPKAGRLVGWGGVLVLAAAAFQAATGPFGRGFAGGVIADDASAFAQVAIFAASAVAIPLGQPWFARRGVHNFEFPVLIVLAALGMGMMVAAGDLISLYVGVELHSLALYVLAAMHRDNAKASEACCSTARAWSTASPARPSSPTSPRLCGTAPTPACCSAWCS